jgi:hypothetical protein
MTPLPAQRKMRTLPNCLPIDAHDVMGSTAAMNSSRGFQHALNWLTLAKPQGRAKRIRQFGVYGDAEAVVDSGNQVLRRDRAFPLPRAPICRNSRRVVRSHKRLGEPGIVIMDKLLS